MANKNYKKIKGYYPHYNTLSMGGHTFTLKNCKKVVGHDDSLPYVANLYIDRKRVCTLFNDGWGGETDITQIVNPALLEQANKDVKGLPFPCYEWEPETPLDSELTISNILPIVDVIAEVVIWIEEAIKKHGAKIVILAVKDNLMRTFKLPCTATTITPKLIEASEKKCEELIAEGWYIVNAPQMHYKN